MSLAWRHVFLAVACCLVLADDYLFFVMQLMIGLFAAVAAVSCFVMVVMVVMTGHGHEFADESQSGSDEWSDDSGVLWNYSWTDDGDGGVWWRREREEQTVVKKSKISGGDASTKSTPSGATFAGADLGKSAMATDDTGTRTRRIILPLGRQ
jgi:hypothetical protein